MHYSPSARQWIWAFPQYWEAFNEIVNSRGPQSLQARLQSLISSSGPSYQAPSLVEGALFLLHSHHNPCRLRALGLIPRLKQDAGDASFPNVIFSAPPSGSKDYVSEVMATWRIRTQARLSTQQWLLWDSWQFLTCYTKAIVSSSYHHTTARVSYVFLMIVNQEVLSRQSKCKHKVLFSGKRCPQKVGSPRHLYIHIKLGNHESCSRREAHWRHCLTNCRHIW